MRHRRRLFQLPVLTMAAVALTATATAVPAQAAPAPAPTQAVPTVPTACAPTADFYTPPAGLPAGNGDLIRCESSAVITDPLTRGTLPAAATRIMYRSNDTQNRAIAVTGTVFSPTAAWTGPGERPLVTYAVGTIGQGDQCAPSVLFNQGLQYELLFISQMLDKGVAVVVTDYEGLGTPGVHTYVDRVSQAHTVLDAARAAQRTPGSGVSASAPIGIYGYSQGGAGSASAAEMAPSYAPELNLKGAAAGDAPADLSTVAPAIDGSTLSGLIGYSINGLSKVYPELVPELDRLLNEQGKRLLAETQNQCVGETTLRYAFQQTSSFTVSGQPVGSFLDQEPFVSAVAAQRLGRLTPTAPVYLFQGANDDVIPAPQARQLATDWCALGATVQYNELAIPPVFPGTGIGHVLPAVLGAGDALRWLYERVTEATPAATSTCAEQG
ncbi:lipase family protein [Rhodococcus sp. X156]|uniref:lipase family protein n=1 Tax=Rhodococcus sp. X156 TaxID=2499145 RepID=UPI001F4951A1|nr:lipase family protein [Rhodococcus sp. X156]